MLKSSVKKLVKTFLPPKWRRRMRELLVSRDVTYTYGPRTIQLARDEAVVTCVLKNGEFYIESFIEHYSRMGFRHIFFLDNGSTDRTLSIAKSHQNVTVCESALPIEAHQASFKKHLARESARGGWCLDADIDEFFDYPSSDVIGLSEFLGYLNKNHYTGVITQLLEMFSDRPLADLPKRQTENITSTYQYYDISAVRREDYRLSELGARYGSGNELASGNVALYWGGIRKTLSGNDYLLTKHSLFCPAAGVELFPHVHFINNARLADISCIMLHYKLVSNAMDAALQNKVNFFGNSKLYADFIEFLESNSTCQIKQDTARKLRGVTELAESGFGLISEAYSKYVEAFAKADSIVMR